jgi:hypothetical protein
MTRFRTYAELSRLETFEERFEYLKLGGRIGEVTFGFDRWVNQRFYQSREWKLARNRVIVRDDGCDLGVPGYEIEAKLLVHHINPLTPNDVEYGEAWIFEPDFLITTSKMTHNAIHYGDASLLPQPHVDRRPGDTRLW